MISRRFRSVLRIETSVRFDVRAASLRLSRLEAMYHYAVQVEENWEENARASLQNKVNALAEESVDKSAQAVKSS
jgi:hypothetical protein